MTPDKKPTLLQQADQLIHGQRAVDYGSAHESFSHIAKIWSALLDKKLTKSITAEEVALLMIGLKSARLLNTPTHTDSWIDIAGYAGCGGETIPESKQEQPAPQIVFRKP